MNRTELEKYILETYLADFDFPWIKYPNYQVFRHSNNKKWFALIMDVPKDKLGLSGTETLEIVNFKCEPAMIGSLRLEPGFFLAYHMNKDSWISVTLDGSVDESKIKLLLDISFELTSTHIKKKKVLS